MSNKISVDKLSKTILKYLEEYEEDIEDIVQDSTDRYTKEAKKELGVISPKSEGDVILKGGEVQKSGSYAKSWNIKKDKKINGVYSKIVYNKKYYRLTHLLEFGHANRDGSRTQPIPHIRKTEDKYREKLEQELKSKIGRL